MTKYDRYQDYVIKDGKFVGEFEQMYRDFDDPWEQTAQEQNAFEKQIALELVRRHGYKRVMELGCGLGDFAAKLSLASETVIGIDVAQTAIDKARKRYPNLNFECADLLDFEIYRRFQPDCIVMSEITWYVLPKLEVFKSFLRTEFGGVGFVHLLTTYAEGEQKYGRDFFTNLDEIMHYFQCISFKVWGCVAIRDGLRTFCYGVI